MQVYSQMDRQLVSISVTIGLFIAWGLVGNEYKIRKDSLACPLVYAISSTCRVQLECPGLEDR